MKDKLISCDPIKIGRMVIYIALVAVCLERMSAIASDLHLWGDGIYSFLKIISERHYFFWFGNFETAFFRSRLFTILLLQTPILIAVHIGITSLTVLSKVFGLTLYGHVFVGLFICYRYSPKKWYLLFPLLSLFAGSMNIEGYIITDSHFILSLYWPSLFLLLFAKELKGWTLFLIVALSIPMVLSYESIIFFGIILIGICGWRLHKFPNQRSLIIGLAIWYLLGIGLAFMALIWPHDPTNMAGFIRGLMAVLSSDHLAAKTSIVILFCCYVLYFVNPRYIKIHGLIFMVGIVAVFCMIVLVLTGRMPTNLDDQVPARVLNLLSPLAASFLLLAVFFRLSNPSRRTIGLTAILIGILGFGQAFWSMGYVMRWEAMLGTLRCELLLKEGLIPYSESIMSRQHIGQLNVNKSHASWPLSLLSIYASQNGEVKSIILPETSFFPFDPLVSSSFPDLSRYGVNYHKYFKAINLNKRYTIGEWLDFTNKGNAAAFVRKGWSYPEQWARWTTAQDAELMLPIQQTITSADVILEADVSPFVTKAHPNISTEIFINNVYVGRWSFTYLPDFKIRNLQLKIPSEVLSRSSKIDIRFHIPEPLKSPSELGINSDPRKLGLAFIKMRLFSVNKNR